MKLTISHVEINGKRRIRVAIETGAFYVATTNFESHHDFVRASNRLKVSEPDLQSALGIWFGRTEIEKAVPLEIESSNLTPAKSASLFSYTIRNELGSTAGSGGEIYSSFMDCYRAAGSNQVIEWPSKDTTCCLDIDDISNTKDIERILSLFSTVQPAPVMFWLSKSGQGIHAIYEADKTNMVYTAEDLAVIAAFRFLALEPNVGVELLHRTRTPPVGGEVFGLGGEQSTNFTLDNLLYSQDTGDDLVMMVCEMYEYEIGKRYPHTMCPVQPSVRAEGKSPPVVVFADPEPHVFCYICQADHRFYGSTKPGYFPFSALAGLAKETNIKGCVEHFVHWGHAQYCMTGFGAFKPEYVKLLYRALLKAKHGADPRIPIAMNCGEPLGMVRHEGFWADSQGKILEDINSKSARIANLPAALYRDGDKLKLNKVAAEWLASGSDLTKMGYKAVKPIHGFQMSQLQELPDSKIFAVLSNNRLPPNKRPKFLAGSERMPMTEAWVTLGQIFPGIKPDLITALCIGRGCSEHRAGLLPMLFITGVTGAAKSSHVEIAAAIYGDSVSTIEMNKDKDRFMNQLIHGKQRSGFLFFDEFFKHAKLARIPDIDAMQTLLGFKENESAYLIYKGEVQLGSMPMFVWADSEIPDEVWMHEQIGRRVYHYHLPSKVRWNVPLAESKILEPQHLRLNGNDKVIHACNTILSDILESYFTVPATDFAVIETLGFKKLENSDKREQVDVLINDLYRHACSSSERGSSTDNRRGFKLLDKLEMLSNLQTVSEKGSTKCRILNATDLAEVLRLTMPAKCEFDNRNGKTYIRFVSYCGKFINEQLRKR